MKKELSLIEQAYIQNYKLKNQQLCVQNPEFSDWLENEYLPLSGKWQY